MRTAFKLVLASSLLLVATPALADEALPPLPTTDAPAPTVAAPPVAIAAPSNGPGLTVVAPLAGGGTVTATGCRNVTVSGARADVRALPACPQAVPAPPADADLYLEEKKQPPADPARKGMIIAAPIVYGLAGMVTGVSYLNAESSCHSYSTRACDRARNWLIGYTTISVIVPSAPRMVVGDWTGALAYGAVRGGSIITAAAIDWGHKDNWQGPFALGFALPVALAVVDLATTPHRALKAESAAPTARITSLAPVAVADASGKTNGAALNMGGTF